MFPSERLDAQSHELAHLGAFRESNVPYREETRLVLAVHMDQRGNMPSPAFLNATREEKRVRLGLDPKSLHAQPTSQ